VCTWRTCDWIWVAVSFVKNVVVFNDPAIDVAYVFIAIHDLYSPRLNVAVAA
jgi:hypothetical protein